MAVEEVIQVPEDLEFEVATGIYRRYAAGMLSLLGRADLGLRIIEGQVVKTPTEGYHDYDLKLNFQVGNEHVGVPNPQVRPTRMVRADVVLVWHCSNAGQITPWGVWTSSPQDDPGQGIIQVQSASSEEVTSFQLTRRDLENIRGRVERYLAFHALREMVEEA